MTATMRAVQVSGALATASAGAGIHSGGPAPLIGRRAARELARRELAETGFWQRLLNWFLHLLNSSGPVVPGGWFGLIALAVLAVVVIAVVLHWARPGRPARTAAPVAGGVTRSAAEHRRAAERLAAAGNYGPAIIEGVRAIAADLEEREVLPARPGRTADELAAEAGRELPGLAAALREVTRLFDDVRYGDRPGTQAGYVKVSRLGADLQKARPVSRAGDAAVLAGPAVPR